MHRAPGLATVLGADKLQTVLGLVAAAAKVCTVPASVKRFGRNDVQYVDLDEPALTSPSS